MEIGKAFSYVMEDENWVNKVLMGGLFSFLCIFLVGIPIVLGYMVQTLRNVIEGQPRPLPAWDNLGEKFMSGLMLTIVIIIYQIPSFLFSCISQLGPMLASSGAEGGQTSETMVGVATTLSMCGGCLNLLWSLVVMVILPALYIRFALTGQIGAAFSFGEMLAFVKADPGSYVIAVLMTIVAGIVGSLGIIACVIGVFFTYFYAQMVMAHLYGQLYRTVTAKGGPALT